MKDASMPFDPVQDNWQAVFGLWDWHALPLGSGWVGHGHATLAQQGCDENLDLQRREMHPDAFVRTTSKRGPCKFMRLILGAVG